MKEQRARSPCSATMNFECEFPKLQNVIWQNRSKDYSFINSWMFGSLELLSSAVWIEVATFIVPWCVLPHS